MAGEEATPHPANEPHVIRLRYLRPSFLGSLARLVIASLRLSWDYITRGASSWPYFVLWSVQLCLDICKITSHMTNHGSCQVFKMFQSWISSFLLSSTTSRYLMNGEFGDGLKSGRGMNVPLAIWCGIKDFSSISSRFECFTVSFSPHSCPSPRRLTQSPCGRTRPGASSFSAHYCLVLFYTAFSLCENLELHA